MKVISIHQPNYLPWLGYFHKIACADVFVLLDTVPFEKNSFINRNKIRTSQRATWLTVPVLLKGKFGILIKDAQVNNYENWNKKHWNTIYFNYKKAPYFNDYSQFFEQVYAQKWDFLSDLNIWIIKYLISVLDINTEILVASKDLSNITGKKQELILNICKFLGANVYLSGRLGVNYIDVQLFAENEIQVCFQDYQYPQYKQLYQPFEPNLSIIDLLFNQGNISLDILMQGNTTKSELLSKCILKKERVCGDIS